jgi:predicted transposase YbfD/YdcC
LPGRQATARQQQTPHAQGGTSAVHLLHAWCDEAGLCLGQYQTPDKANEITALPDLLALLDVQGCLLTMDAIGCQKSVTQVVATAGAEYLLALKGNQPTLHTAVEAAFATTADAEAATTTGEKPAHGRVETRTCRVLPADRLPAALRGPEWVGMQTLIEVVATRTVSATGVTTTETRHYLSSRQASAADFQGYVRRHWGIENRLHWVLDVVFGEDHSRKRAGHVAANCAIIRKFVLNLLRAQPESKSLNRKRNLCALSDEYRQKCLGF